MNYREIRQLGALCIFCNLLSACGTTRQPEPVIRTVEVRVPVISQCVPPSTPDHPPARTDVGAIRETGALLQAMAAELVERRQYDDSVAPVLEACRHTP